MGRQLHGVFSLSLLFIAILLGMMIILKSSIFWALAYLGLSIIASVIIVYSFCSKCPCKSSCCGHVLPGKLAEVLPERAEGTYSVLDYIGVVIPILVIFLYPQYWLGSELTFLFIFWGLVVIALFDITLCVCRGCQNKYCPVSKTLN